MAYQQADRRAHTTRREVKRRAVAIGAGSSYESGRKAKATTSSSRCCTQKQKKKNKQQATSAFANFQASAKSIDQATQKQKNKKQKTARSPEMDMHAPEIRNPLPTYIVLPPPPAQSSPSPLKRKKNAFVL